MPNLSGAGDRRVGGLDVQDTHRRAYSHCRTALPAFVMALAILLCGPAVAQNDSVPAQRLVTVDWAGVARDAAALSPTLAAPTPNTDAALLAQGAQELARYAVADKEALRPLAHLNAFMAPAYPGVQSVPVPVLAPVLADRYLAELARTGLAAKDASQSFLSSSVARMQFLPKTTGYDAILTVSPDLLRRLQLENAALTQIHIGAAALLYDDADRRGAGPDQRGTRVEDNDLRASYPDLRRYAAIDEVSYNFTKYGVIYFASIACQGESWPATRVVPCSRTDAILKAALLELRLIGGAPIAIAPRAEPEIPRPPIVSPTFKFITPGKLLEGTDQDGLGGVTTKRRWGPANLIFPIRLPSAFANSQIFMHGGNCLGQKIPMSNGQYKCRQNQAKVLEDRENHLENYDHPWRDTYCEVRDEVGRLPKDCPAGSRAHEGQDIRPRECAFINGRCKTDLFDVVAVTKGMAMWTALNHLRLIADDGTTLYYMYLHMSPSGLARAGMQQEVAVPVVAGQKVGEVSNWWKTDENGTTTHLHFEIRDRSEACGGYGCTRAPYWTLILAYERLINMRGTEIPQ